MTRALWYVLCVLAGIASSWEPYMRHPPGLVHWLQFHRETLVRTELAATKFVFIVGHHGSGSGQR